MCIVPQSLKPEVTWYYWTVNVVSCSHQQPPTVLKVVQKRGQGALGRRRWLLCGFWEVLFFCVLCWLLDFFFSLGHHFFPRFLSSPVRFLHFFVILFLLLIMLSFPFFGWGDIWDRFRHLWISWKRLAGFIVVLIVFRWYLYTELCSI